MYPHPDPVDPIDVAYEKLFLEMPTGWRQYDFEAMSDAEQQAVHILVLKGGAELKIRCLMEAPGSAQKLRVVAVVCGDYMRNWHANSQSLMDETMAAGAGGLGFTGKAEKWSVSSTRRVYG